MSRGAQVLPCGAMRGNRDIRPHSHTPCRTRRVAWTGAAARAHQVSVTTRFDMCHSLASEPKINITDCLGII